MPVTVDSLTVSTTRVVFLSGAECCCIVERYLNMCSIDTSGMGDDSAVANETCPNQPHRTVARPHTAAARKG